MSAKRNSKHSKKSQRGGGSDWRQSFYAYFMSPAELSRYTLKHIDQAPMFNPLEFNTVMPTGTSGIIPTGVYLANHPSEKVKSKDYDVKARVCSEAMSGGGCGQRGGENNDPASYPRDPLSAEYIGVSCGEGEGCGKYQPYRTDKNGRLERCKVHYSSTTSKGIGCGVCRNGDKPSIWNSSMSSFPNANDCSSCLTCPPCSQYAEYKSIPSNGSTNPVREVYNKLLSLNSDQLLALCKDNYVRVYDMDLETGRLTPETKSRVCKRLAKKMASS